jgi:hypothetical protein
VRPGQAALDAHAVDGDVLVDPLPDGLAAGDDGVPATVLAHGLGGEVGVGAGAVPVAQDRLGLERGVDPEVLGDAEEQPPGHPQVVADVRGESTPTWNSHWPIITSALVPSMPMPASMQAAVCSSTISRPGILSPPTPQ